MKKTIIIVNFYIRMSQVSYFIISCVLIICSSHYAMAAEQNRPLESRRILALYDSTEGRIINSNIHGRLEMPLNRLGLSLDYLDIAKQPLPTTSAYRGILMWFNDEKMKKPEVFLRWLRKELKKNQRLVCFGSFGAHTNEKGEPVESDLYDSVLAEMGLVNGEYGYMRSSFQVLYDDAPDRVGSFNFETSLAPVELIYQDIRAQSHGMKAWRTIRRRDKAGSRALAIGVGKRGGVVFEPTMAYRVFTAPQWQIRWDLNPFHFLEAAFNTAGLPRADVTSISNARLAFSHIDGDGMANKSINLPGKVRISPEVCYDEILQKYTYPITVGLVACRIDTKGLVRDELKTFKNIMSLPYVTPSAHGYAHPMNWAKGEVGIKYPGYVYSDYQETVGALKMVEKLTVTADKKAELFLWTGDCDPTEKQLALVRENGYYNLNGGNSRFDSLYNSRSTITPLSVQKGKELQVYAPAGNEYLYTNGWRENKGGFVHILETFKRTKTPRLLPVNLYYHFYLCENQAGLASLHTIYSWLASEELAWVSATQYCKMVIDFKNMKMGKLSPDGSSWWIETKGDLQTIRFDNETRQVDMEKSKGVLGWDHFNGALYISLHSSRAEIYLTDKKIQKLSLKKASYALYDVTLTSKKLTAQLHLFGTGGFIDIRVPAAKTPRALLNNTKIIVEQHTGFYRIVIPGGRGELQEIEIGI